MPFRPEEIKKSRMSGILWMLKSPLTKRCGPRFSENRNEDRVVTVVCV